MYNPLTEELIVEAGELIEEDVAKAIEASPIDAVEVRSALSCEAKKGICTKCYGRNLSNR